MTNQEAANKIEKLLNSVNIKTAEVTVTRASIIVKTFGQSAAIEAANVLNATGQWNVKIYRPEENMSGYWKVGGMVSNA